MLQNINIIGTKPTCCLNEDENLDMMLNNNTESYKIMRNQKVKPDSKGNKRCLINYEENKFEEDDIIVRTRKRSNSVDLYKKHKKERERRNKLKNNNINNDNIKNEKNGDIYNIENDTKEISKKNSKNLKCKKVSFLSPNFVTIIDVESYKKFNEENTCKDPFEDIELLNNHIAYMDKINNNNNNNININNNNLEDDGKERVQCTCTIF